MVLSGSLKIKRHINWLSIQADISRGQQLVCLLSFCIRKLQDNTDSSYYPLELSFEKITSNLCSSEGAQYAIGILSM